MDARDAHMDVRRVSRNAEDQRRSKAKARSWIPAFAGMTKLKGFHRNDERAKSLGPGFRRDDEVDG